MAGTAAGAGIVVVEVGRIVVVVVEAGIVVVVVVEIAVVAS